MSDIRFSPADMSIDRALMIDLNVEYMTWVANEMDAYFEIDTRALVGAPVREYVEGTIDKVCSDGIFFVARQADMVIGMGAFRKLGQGRGEIKRMYIRPSHRGQGHGAALLGQLIRVATGSGCLTICLDSAPFMTTAHQLYRSAGFTDRQAYPETEVPPQLRARWLFMEMRVGP